MITFDRDRCTGCGVCVNVCPQGVLELSEKTARMTDYESCMECGACQLNCEERAVEVTKGTGCLVAIIKEDILKIAPKGAGCCGPDGTSNKSCC